jgi:virulence factor Mce-like protein
MRRLVIIGAALLAGLGVFSMVGAGEDSSKDGVKKYKILLDNAFGLTPGVDVRVGGVRAGKIDKFDIDRKTNRALVSFSLQAKGFDDFRKDVFCEIRPQSLIGEYYLDCRPGTSSQRLDPDVPIPVDHTATTVPADLVQNILREPYGERLRIIFNELGAGFAGRGDDLNETIRRASPALRETDKTLAVLAANKEELQSLTRESAVVLDALANRRKDVGRFVGEARDSARASADRRGELAGTIRRLPGFLAQLRPTLRDLGTAADAQTPALTDLRAAAGDLTSFFNKLGPFAEASRPAIRTLGETSDTGREAVRAAAPTIAEVRKLTRKSPELAKNLAIVLEHLNDRNFATEPNAASPGGKGFTGLEAVLQYPFTQSQAINIFDTRGYLLKILLKVNDCAKYTNAKTAREDPARTKRCSQALGPVQPGINAPDPSATPAARSAGTGSAKTGLAADVAQLPAAVRDLLPTLTPRRGAAATGSPSPASTPAPAGGNPTASQTSVLDFLLAP